MAAVDALVTHHFATMPDGVRLHYVSAGEGPLVLLLHGFPELWYAWRDQIPALARAGYRVVAPDMRGYNRSDKPRPVSAYHPRRLAADVDALIAHLGGRCALLVGHDWGGAVAWFAAHWHGARIERLAILNAPHPSHGRDALSNPRQLLRSWYIFFFQLPWLPEFYARAFDYRRLRKILTDEPQRPGAFSPEDITRYVQAAREPGATHATINYYRALLRANPVALARDLEPLPMPVQVLWGLHDRYLGPSVSVPPPALVPDCHIDYVPEASHWIQCDTPARVNEILLHFARGEPSGSLANEPPPAG